MSITDLNQFHNQVMQDETLQQKLATTPANEQLSRLAVELGRNLSLEFNEALQLHQFKILAFTK